MEYILFSLCLLAFNTLSKAIYPEVSNRLLVVSTSILIFIVFVLLGNNPFKLALWGFATFGFYDFVGRYIEEGVYRLLKSLGTWF